MAKCPRCEIHWQWDWCGDTYRKKEDGAVADMKEFKGGEEGLAEVSYCDCGEAISIIVLSGDDLCGEPLNHPEWKDIDWEADEHCYPEQ